MKRIKKIRFPAPSLIKPKPLYTGKQVISTVLKNIVEGQDDYSKAGFIGLNLDSKSKLNSDDWGPIGKEEGEVIFRDSELLQGTLDKNQFGAVEYGLVHAVYEVYGSEKAGELLTALARIFTNYLQSHGFTCGIDDLVCTQKTNRKRRRLIEEYHKKGVEKVAEFCGIPSYKANDYNYSSRVVY